MSSNQEDLLQRLRATFRVEAQEHVQTIASGLIQLERAKPGASGATLDTVFRAAHSLKGAARAVNASAVESVCQSLESVFSALKRNGVAASPALFDLLHRTADMLAQLLALLDESTPLPLAAIAELRQALKAALARPAPAPAPATAPALVAAAGDEPANAPEPLLRALPDSVRVRTRTLDTVLLQSEELLYAKVAAAQRADALRSLRQRPAGWRSHGVRLGADVRAVESAFAAQAGARLPVYAPWARLRAYLHDSQDFAAALETDLLRQSKLAEQDQRVITAMVDQLLDEMKQIVVQPFSTLLDFFGPAVRGLARDLDKPIELVIEGAEIQIDRRILDEIKDPLIHLVRNSVDHGIEAPAVRREKGKPPNGSLTIAVSQRNGGQVEIMVRDDGAGIDAQALQRAAVNAGVLAADAAQALSRERTLPLAFEPGVSTSPLITDLSGRGLGLAIVKQQVDRLAGSLSLESAPGQGTTFRLVLPLTLARFRGVLVRMGRQTFVLPTRSVEKVARIAYDQVKTVENRETISLDGQVLALVRLSAVLGLPDGDDVDSQAGLPVVVLGGGPLGQSIAFGVDQVLDEREVLVKPLGRQLERVRHIAGATLIGSGQVVPILHVPDLMGSAVKGAAAPGASANARKAAAPAVKSVLVAEDSITSRTLLKGILEGAGYRVETAADGVDAFTALRSGAFDVVVSDVDMPRLNGFGLTARIRADKKLADLPVVLVTALESREDREQGIDVGASAYIVKSSFDQGNLLEVVRRLA